MVLVNVFHPADGGVYCRYSKQRNNQSSETNR